MCAPLMPASVNGPSSEAGPWERAASMASRRESSRASVRPEVPSTSRYSSRMATGVPSTSPAASAMPGAP